MKVAVVVPARNAAHHLDECLATVRHQTRQVDEIFLVVGPSQDCTALAAGALQSPPVRVVDNPAGDRASAINSALAETDADVVALVDAQSRLAPEYVESSIAALDRHQADVVGGPMRPRGRTLIGEAMAAALQSPVAVGNSQFHFAGVAREAESVYLGVYRSKVFGAVGKYNAALLRTEDDDMNARIREAGFRIWLDPAIHSTYLCRDSLRAIWHQYYGYGYWKVALATIRPSALRVRHFAPTAFVAAIVLSLVVSAMTKLPIAAALVATYLAFLLLAGLAAPAERPTARFLFPLVVATMHLAYGFGAIVGLLRWERLRRIARAGKPAGGHP